MPKRNLLSMAVCSMMVVMACPGSVYALGDPLVVPQAPLTVAKGVPPNLLYMHDDSGSMTSCYMPDSMEVNNGLLTHSPLINSLAYDHTVTYSPPKDETGVSLPDSNYTAAWNDGYRANGYGPANNTVTDLSKVFKPCLGVVLTPPGGYYLSFKNSCDPAQENDRINSSCYDTIFLNNRSNAEKQNFANWYSYYWSRVMASRAGISVAFSGLDEQIRVGWAQINQGAIAQNVSEFTGNHRKQFFNWLFTVSANGNTPLRLALKRAGDYFDNASASGPWATDGKFLSCRRSYTILMSDGFYNDAAASVALGNVDNTVSSSIHLADGTQWSYTPVDPFRDTTSNTLADVAMYYWNRDLLPGVDNNVPPTTKNPSTWQNMGTYTVGLGVSAAITNDQAWDAVFNQTAINWNQVPVAIFDMQHAAINGRGDFFQASNPAQFVDAINSILQSISVETSVAAPITASSARLSNDMFAFNAEYTSTDWHSRIIAYQYNTTSKKFSLAWDTIGKDPNPQSRLIYTWDPYATPPAATKLEWSGSQLSSGYKADFMNDSEDYLKWFRGDRNQEQKNGGAYRDRSADTVLGDIINANLLFVGRDNYGYGYYGGIPPVERTAYSARIGSTSFQTRPQMVFAGSNDGMLHAFNAADGTELFSYVPYGPGSKLAHVGDVDFVHNYMVDGPVTASDAYINGQWKTVVVGTLGAGAEQSKFALDTKGTYFALNVENLNSDAANDRVLWEFTDSRMGTVVMSKATITRARNGKWVAIFGNGYRSSAGPVLMIVDLESGTLIKAIEATADGAYTFNGLSSPVGVDIDRDGIIDLAYAGDLEGNLWKFDLTDKDPTQWKVAYGGKPLLRAVDGDGNRQPITGQPAVGSNSMGDGVVVYFGTGSYFAEADVIDKDVQSFYGVFDQCGLDVSGPCASAGGNASVKRSELLPQKIIEQKIVGEIEYRTVSDDPATDNTTGDLTHKGFVLDLLYNKTKEGERIITQPNLDFSDRVVVTTLITEGGDEADPCAGSGTTGWTMQLDPFSGGRLGYAVYDVTGDGLFDAADKINGNDISGMKGGSNVAFGFGSDEALQFGSGGTPPSEVAPDIEMVGRRSWLQYR